MFSSLEHDSGRLATVRMARDFDGVDVRCRSTSDGARLAGVYEIVLAVAACLRAGTRVDVAWPVSATGLTPRANEALAITPGGGRIGSILGGAAHDQLSQLAAQGGGGRLVALSISEFEAQLAGLPSGGDVRCLLLPATELPAPLWDRLRHREPVCLVARFEPGGRVSQVELYDRDSIDGAGEDAVRLFGAATSGAAVSEDAVTTVFWPVPTLVIVGASPVGDALRANAELLGWQVRIATEQGVTTGLIASLAPIDSVVVVSHELELAGIGLAAALDSQVGYIGALGSHRMQEMRADWLAFRGITDTSRVHGPAGLGIGARTPAEIAVAILAQAVAVRAGHALP